MHSSKNVVRPERFELPTFWFVASRKRRSLQIYLVCLASLTNQSPLLFLLIVVPNVVRKQKGDRPVRCRVRIQAPNSRGSGLVSIEASTYAQRLKRGCRTRSGAAGGLSLQDGELLPKRKVFEPQTPTLAEKANNRGQTNSDNV